MRLLIYIISFLSGYCVAQVLDKYPEYDINQLIEVEWSGEIRSISDNEFALMIKRGDTILEAVIDGQGGAYPEIISIDHFNACDVSYLVASSQIFFYFDFPVFVIERHIFSLHENNHIATIQDNESRVAGGVVPARISKPIYEAINCELESRF